MARSSAPAAAEPLLRLDRRRLGPLGEEVRPMTRTPVPQRNRGIEHDEVGDVGSPGEELEDPVVLGLPADHEQRHPGVADDVRRLCRGVGGVDRHGDGADAEDRRVGHRPLGTVRRVDADPVAVPHTGRDEGRGSRADDVTELGVRDRPPGAALFQPHRGTAGEPQGALADGPTEMVAAHRGLALRVRHRTVRSAPPRLPQSPTPTGTAVSVPTCAASPPGGARRPGDSTTQPARRAQVAAASRSRSSRGSLER